VRCPAATLAHGRKSTDRFFTDLIALVTKEIQTCVNPSVALEALVRALEETEEPDLMTH